MKNRTFREPPARIREASKNAARQGGESEAPHDSLFTWESWVWNSMKVAKRRRGRPTGSTVKPPDFYADVWVTVRFFRIRTRSRTGQTPSARQACEEIIAEGGFISAVGGTIESLEAANGKRKKRRSRFKFGTENSAVMPTAAGPIFASHSVTNARTLQNQYNEANRIARSDRRTRLAWMNLCRQRFGYPAKGAWNAVRRMQSPRHFIAN
jgi:hypothetical protein